MKITAILLASGASTRFGKPKQLIRWRDDFLINSIIEIIYEAGVKELAVILGFAKQDIEPIITTGPKIIENQEWPQGKSASIRLGVKEALSNFSDAVIFFTIDQPFLQPELIKQIIIGAEKLQSAIIAASVGGVPTVPMLFRKDCFEDLLQLEGESGGKDLLNIPGRDAVFIDWEDEKLLMDIDTEEDLRKAVEIDQNDS